MINSVKLRSTCRMITSSLTLLPTAFSAFFNYGGRGLFGPHPRKHSFDCLIDSGGGGGTPIDWDTGCAIF